MKKRFTLPLILTLVLSSLFLATPPVLTALTDSSGIETYHPPQALQITWYADVGRLEVDIYPDGEWQLAPDCYDWPASCWEIVGRRWSFTVARDAAGQWALAATAGDYTPDEHGVEQALVRATLAALNAGDPGGFAVFNPAFDRCYVDLVTAIGQGEWPAAGVWPQAGPWSRCPW
ncbi:MAG: hypothetical protein D6759_03595 [Chloroflexi bacterium]|nr:MAG: hypothetical protein D6759_03595 [Chloroflexota bacterium]